MDLIPPPDGAGPFNAIVRYIFDYEKEGVLVGKTDLESILDENGFGAATEMGVFTLDKGPEVSLLPEPFWIYIFNSSEPVGEATKITVSNTFPLIVT